MPLLFEIYSNGRRLTDYLVRGGHATGAESLPLAGRVAFEEGLLRVEAGDSNDAMDGYGTAGDPGDEAAAYAGLSASAAAVGVSLLWDAGACGEYVLETTRLPPSPKPSVLNVELARHRLMRLMQKQEDWNLWELAPAAGAVAKAKAAQVTFAEALALLHDRPAASMKADEALSAAIEAGEMLARVHGDLLMQRRRRSGLPRTLFGIRADVTGNAPLGNAAYRSAIVKGFDCVSVPMPWRLMQPEEETFETASVDAAVDLAGRAKMPIVAGPLIDLSDVPEPSGRSDGAVTLSAGGVPEWLFLYENNFEALCDLAFNYVRAIVQRYRRVVKLWNVVSGIHAASSFGLTFEQMIELTRLLVGQVKAVLPGAKTLVTIRQPCGEYLTAMNSSATSVPPMLYAEMVSQSGVQVDGFGVEIVTGRPTHGRRVRDLFQISSMLDRFATLGKPLFVTSVSCPDAPGTEAGKSGRWGNEWSREVQAAWLRDVYNVALAKPFVENVAWSDLVDGPHNQIEGGALFDDLLVPKPAAHTLQQIRSAARPFLRAARDRRQRSGGDRHARRCVDEGHSGPFSSFLIALLPAVALPDPPTDPLDPRPESGPDPKRWPGATRRWWSPSQIRGLAVICGGLLALYAVQRLARPTLLADPPPPRGDLADELQDRLDPNVATEAELAALPNIGPGKAAAIVAHRASEGTRFTRTADLDAVHGIGPAIVAKLRPHLFFPEDSTISSGRDAGDVAGE